MHKPNLQVSHVISPCMEGTFFIKIWLNMYFMQVIMIVMQLIFLDPNMTVFYMCRFLSAVNGSQLPKMRKSRS